MAKRLERLSNEQYRTPQEAWLIGGTEDVIPGEENWYKPIAAFRDGVDISTIQKERARVRVFISSLAGIGIGVEGRAVITFEQLDPQSGKTLKDPQLVGWEKEDGEIIDLDPKEWTSKMVEFFKRTNSDPIYR